MTKYSNITLKWGITDDTELYDWHRQTVLGDIKRKKRFHRFAQPQGRRGGEVEFQTSLAHQVGRPPI
jgi:hypothetical protein